MCQFSAPPGYVRKKPPARPKLGPFISIIDAILAADMTAPPKQRHTAKRIYDRLRAEHGFDGGYSAVKEYVRLARSRARETFVPLAHPPGHAQVDFGEAIGVIGGVRQKMHVFFMDLPHSDAPFIKAYPAETTEAFLDGHVSAFATLHEGSKAEARWQRISILRLESNVSAQAIGILMASYHVAGKTVWRPYAQADHIYRLHTLHGLSLEEIADVTRMQPGKVVQYLAAYKYLVTEVLPHADNGREREVLEKRFHHALEFVSRRNLAELRDDPTARQDLAKLLVENKIKGAEVRQLDKVLKHHKASSALKESGFTAAKHVLREVDPVAASRVLQEMKAFTRKLCKIGQDDIALFKGSNPAQEVLRELAEALRNLAAVADVKLGH